MARRIGAPVGNGLLLAAACGLIAAGLGVAMSRRRTPPPVSLPTASMPDTNTLVRRFIMYFIVPLWHAAGIADWLCHRRTAIEKTSGGKESLIHLLMLAEMGVPVLACLFLEINAPVLALIIAAFFAHEATAMWDVSYAITRRKVSPIEQHVHSFLEMLPLMAASFITVLYWPKFLELIGLAGKREMKIRLKREPLPVAYVTVALGAVLVFEILPYVEELRRCWRANPGHLVPPRAGRLAQRSGRTPAVHVS
jgi:hypothetical protein